MLHVAVLPLIALMLASGPALAQVRQSAKPVFVNVEQQAEAERLRACPSGRWRWRERDRAFPTPMTRAAQELDVPGGRLIGTNRGEWRGELRFRSLTGQESVLSYDNVLGLMPAKDGAIVLFGLMHLGTNRGYAMRARQKNGVWSLTFIDKLPGRPVAISALGDYGGPVGEHFAVATRPGGDNRAKASVVIVNEFSAREQADCISEPQRRRPR